MSVGNVTTGDPGTQASVTNVGTLNKAILDFVIPQGPTGATGSSGVTGATGATGATAPSIYAQQGKCRNHAAFSTLKTIKQPL